MPSIKDVAENAGVSIATVSRVLANKPHVRPEVRQRVLTAVQELNYRPNLIARSLRAKKSNTIGLIVADIQNPFFTALSRAVEDVAYEQGMSLFLCNTDEDADKEAIYLELMRDKHVAGIIISPTRETSDAFFEMLKWNIPMVVIDRQVDDVEVDTVLIDNTESAYRLTEHLIADGHRRIGAMFGLGSSTGRHRREGFLQALQDHGLEAAPELVVDVNAREEDGYQTTQQFLSLPEPPNAILTSSGLLSAGAFRALRESKLTIPDDIGFASFDETGWATLVDPPITVVRQPTYEIGQKATDLLLERIKAPSRSVREIILKGQLIVRASCGRHTQSDTEIESHMDISVKLP
ncbi:MAG: LacI family DNA-binding transcriptional regulator [Anaerolineae bacterium]|nr:LacI family DNA-binding transcriptional regulator [Anaerolineae bacterium]